VEQRLRGEPVKDLSEPIGKADGPTIWERKADGGFPDAKTLKQRVRDRLDPGRDLGHIDRGTGAKSRN